MLYGKDWRKVQTLLKTRNIIQIRTHAQKVFKKVSMKKKDGTRNDENDDINGEKLSSEVIFSSNTMLFL